MLFGVELFTFTPSKKRNMSNIYHDLEKITIMANYYAKKHGVNYNVIILNPTEKGEFDAAHGSTYEFVRDSYFDKPRTNVKKLFRTEFNIVEIEQRPMFETTPFFIVDGDCHNNPTAEFERRFATPIVRTSPKIGNNDCCHCGSGKKFKKCCK